MLELTCTATSDTSTISDVFSVATDCSLRSAAAFTVSGPSYKDVLELYRATLLQSGVILTWQFCPSISVHWRTHEIGLTTAALTTRIIEFFCKPITVWCDCCFRFINFNTFMKVSSNT